MAPSQLPPHHNLFIATPNAIHLYTQSTPKRLFSCSTADGILNTRPAKDNSGLLAVADSHLVILYDAQKGRDRKYTLKSGDGEPRLLLFSPTSRTLYFTTTLNHSIQAYSIPTAELLPPLTAHPSPPNILAISEDGDFLLSASPSPPTIIIQDLRQPGSAPLRYYPAHARSVIKCASFRHSNTSQDGASGSKFCFFVLGFQDGTLALYRLSIPPLTYAPTSQEPPQQPYTAALKEPIKVGAVKKLHKPAIGGILAAEFLPSYKARVVSVGYDGKCRIVDFEDGGEVLRTWRIGDGAPTCMCASSPGSGFSKRRASWNGISGSDDAVDEAKDEQQSHEGKWNLVAVGTDAGKIFVFDALGLLVCEIDIGTAIVAIEWVGDMDGPSLLPNRRPSFTSTIIDPALRASSRKSSQIQQPLDMSDRTSSDEETGTVQRTKPPLSEIHPALRPRPNDLFSTPSPPNTSTPLSSIQLSLPTTHHATKRPRKSYPRPRILSRTFQSPTPRTPKPSPSVLLTRSPTTPTRLQIPATQDARRWPQIRSAEDTPPMMSGALSFTGDGPHTPTNASNANMEINKQEPPETFITPPTSPQHHARSSGLFSPPKSPSPTPLAAKRGVRFRRASSPETGVFYSSSPLSTRASRRRSFSVQAQSAVPRTVDGEAGEGREDGCDSFVDCERLGLEPDKESTVTPRKRGHRMRRLFKDTKVVETGMEMGRDAGRRDDDDDSQSLRAEMRALRREFVLLREALILGA